MLPINIISAKRFSTTRHTNKVTSKTSIQQRSHQLDSIINIYIQINKRENHIGNTKFVFSVHNIALL